MNSRDGHRGAAEWLDRLAGGRLVAGAPPPRAGALPAARAALALGLAAGYR